MQLPAPRHRYTFAEYLDFEEVAGVRHEFYDGEIYGMAGGTPEHAAMAAARGEKLLHYQQIPSLEAAVLIDHDQKQIELCTRSSAGWQSQRHRAGEVVPLAPIEAQLAVDLVFAAAQGA